MFGLTILQSGSKRQEIILRVEAVTVRNLQLVRLKARLRGVFGMHLGRRALTGQSGEICAIVVPPQQDTSKRVRPTEPLHPYFLNYLRRDVTARNGRHRVRIPLGTPLPALSAPTTLRPT